MKYLIATRGSKLALYQAEHVQQSLAALFPEHEWGLEVITTTGDRIQDRPLVEFGGKGVFLKEIEEALLRGSAHLAVHSLKDVPAAEHQELELTAFLPREDPRDVWVSEQEQLMHLPPGKTVGTSSLRRTLLLRFYRPDLRIELLRGNLDTRIRKLKEGRYDAIIVAAAGLHRLQLFDEKCMHYLFEDAFVPAIGQGIMVVQTKKTFIEIKQMVSRLNDVHTATAASIERGLLAKYDGGCHLPIGALATHCDAEWHLRAFLGGARSGKILQEHLRQESPELCVSLMYERFQAGGASELLSELV